MSEKEIFAAVTIGPILDTINLASSPSALWAASYMMSTLSKNICKKLVESGVDKNDIISPYYDPDDELLKRNDGVGLFHDRVIYKLPEKYCKEDVFKEHFKAVRENAIIETIGYFGFEEEMYNSYFKDYFLVSAVLLNDTHNPIMDSGKMLDCLELSKRFVSSSKSDPILSFFNSEETEGSRNDAIRRRVVDKMEIYNWQLLNANRDKIRSLGDIANAFAHSDEALKKNKYYAVVRSDGDRISKIIEKLDAKKIRAFSRVCLQYCSDIANKVKTEYGGIAVYAGGDDLLAIMPVENHNKKTVFDFAEEANKLFTESFSKNKDFKRVYAGNDEKLMEEYDSLCRELSLSFGIFVSYYKFPLYEALEQSARLLFGVAKSVRNCAAVRFQKHAGQSEGLLIPNSDMPELKEFLKKCVEKKASSDNEKKKSDDKKKSSGNEETMSGSENAASGNEETTSDNKKESSDNEKKTLLDDKVILSALHKIELFGSMFNHAEGDSLKNLFENTFDAYSQQTNVFLQTTLYEYFRQLKEDSNILILSDDGDKKDKENEKHEKSDTSDSAEKTEDKASAKDYAKTLNYILRIVKFFIEKAGERE